MAKIGLVSSIYNAALAIDFGRKGFATRGKAEEGRISYEKGIAEAMTAFQENLNIIWSSVDRIVNKPANG